MTKSKRLITLILSVVMCLSLGIIKVSANSEAYKEFTTPQQARDWGKQHYSIYLFSEAQKKAFNAYSKNSSPYNKQLRNGVSLSDLSKEEQDRIAVLDHALSYAIIPENIIVYRYANTDFLRRLGYSQEEITEHVYNYQTHKLNTQAADYLNQTKIVGRIDTDPGFLSTTLVKGTVFTHRPIELRIRVRRLVMGTYISLPGIGFFNQELEVLFPRQRQLQVLSVRMEANKLRIEVQMLGPYYAKNPPA